MVWDRDLLLRETVEIVNEAVGGGDLMPEVHLFVFRPGGGQPPVEVKHLCDQGGHPVVPLPGRQIGEIE